MDPSPSSPVIIIGAGLVGLVLAQALSARSIPYLIYEQDPHASHRGVGWGLTIHWALEIFKFLVPASIVERLPEAFVDPKAVKSGEKGNFLFYDLRKGNALWKVPPSQRLRLRREAFRQLLLDHVDVQWAKQITDVDTAGDDQIRARFCDGTSSPYGSLVVGCDGARSEVRKLLLPHSYQNHQLPVRLLGVSVVFAAAVAKPLRDLDPYFMQGGDKETDVFLWFSFLDGPSNNTRTEKDSFTCQILISWPVRPEKGLPEVPVTAGDRLALMKHLSRDWADPFHSIIEAIPDNAEPTTLRLEDWPPPLHPREHGWDNVGGRVTLAGDSAHAMTMQVYSPNDQDYGADTVHDRYRGKAFNHGLRDLQVLVHELEPLYNKGNPFTTDQRKTAIDAYEADLCSRGRPAVLASRRACLDAHMQEGINEKSPLMARRAIKLEELEDLE